MVMPPMMPHMMGMPPPHGMPPMPFPMSMHGMPMHPMGMPPPGL